MLYFGLESKGNVTQRISIYMQVFADCKTNCYSLTVRTNLLSNLVSKLAKLQKHQPPHRTCRRRKYAGTKNFSITDATFRYIKRVSLFNLSL